MASRWSRRGCVGVLILRDAPIGEVVERRKRSGELGFDGAYAADHTGGYRDLEGCWFDGWTSLRPRELPKAEQVEDRPEAFGRRAEWCDPGGRALESIDHDRSLRSLLGQFGFAFAKGCERLGGVAVAVHVQVEPHFGQQVIHLPAEVGEKRGVVGQ